MPQRMAEPPEPHSGHPGSRKAESPVLEKRHERRESGSGPVRLRFDHARPVAGFEGRLIDWSRGGFRAGHSCRLLQTGDIVEFEHEHGCGLARVVWLRISYEGVESGFVVLSQS